ncbi:tripartite tricarboxylate transporter substrate binding protein [Oceanobacillus jeddahense]|uniref:tripartite tricarboxylate transporter substrate binding protein n=1 Tax=Oceanobacillus jeddahense TaxID=1462527 RepID=UPI0005958C32|nr:tripartite tricarboxylate transporter substrate-binding protein [Oceanobacillus jeddahense]
MKIVIGSFVTMCLLGVFSMFYEGDGNNQYENYPERSVTTIVPSGTGGGIDTSARVISSLLADKENFPVSMLVENRPGGGQAVGLSDFVTRYSNDDYRLFLPALPLIINNLKEDGNSPFGFRDLTPLAQINSDFSVLAVHKDSEFDDLQDLLDVMHEDPSSVTFGGGSAPGSQDHLNIMLVMLEAGIDPEEVSYVSYDGGGEAVTSLLGQNIDVLSSHLSGASEYYRSGDIKILGYSGKVPIEGEFSELVSYYDQGVDVEFNQWRGVFGPKDMDDELIEYWDNVFEDLILSEEWESQLDINGWQPGYKNSEDFEFFLEEQEKEIYEVLKVLEMNAE